VGDPGLTVVNPAAQSVLWNDKVTYEREVGGQKVVAATLRYGGALALGNVGARDLAVLVGTGTIEQDTQSRPLLMVVSLDDPSHPVGLGYVPLDDASVVDVILKDDMALLGGSQQVTLVSLTDPANPAVVGTVQGVGGRLAISENDVLFSTARSVFGGTEVPLGGVRTAALGSLAIIERVTPSIVAVDDSGRTSQALQVTYRFIAPPDDLQAAYVKFYSRETLLGTYPVPSLEEGRFGLTIPGGVALNPPSETLEIKLRNPDGSTTAPVFTTIGRPVRSSGTGTQPMVLWPVFEAVTPGFAFRGSMDVLLKVTGKDMSGVTRVFVRGASGEWTPFETTSRSATSASFKLPASMLSEVGFLQVSPSENDVRSVGFLVGDRALADLGTAQGVVLTAVDPQELGPGGGLLRVMGFGFTQGMAIVIGRGGLMTLPSSVIDDDEIEALLPGDYIGLAEDLDVAVLTPDGTALSASLPVRSTVAQRPIDYSSVVSAGKTLVTAVHGSLVWSDGGQEQTIELEGVGLEPGMQVFFSAGSRPPQTGQTEPASSPPPMPTATVSSPPTPTPTVPTIPPVATVSVKVPKDFTNWPATCIVLEPAPKTKLPPSAPRCVGSQAKVEIPLGGRVKFAAYAADSDEPLIYVVGKEDPAAGDISQYSANCKPSSAALPDLTLARKVNVGGKEVEKVEPARVTFSFEQGSIPSVPNPFSTSTLHLPDIPLVAQEGNRCDPDTPNLLYLRGVRKPTGNETLTLVATHTDPGSGVERKGRIQVTVRDSRIGPSTGKDEIDAALMDAAGRTGVPPQVLKAQASIETGFDPTLYRYEPMTIDFLYVSGDIEDNGVLARNNTTYGRYIRKHMVAGTAALPPQPNDPRYCVAILGPEAAPAENDVKDCDKKGGESASVTPVEIAPVSTRILGRQGMPIDANYRLADAKATALPGGATFDLVEAPYWSHADQIQPLPDPKGDQFRLDYSRNRVLLGRPLTKGEWLKLTYRAIKEETILTPGACGNFDVTTFKVKDYPALDFRAGDTIGGWLERNIRQQKDGFLTGTDSEKHIEFRFDSTVSPRHPIAGRRVGVMDSRFRVATAQFIAAGSFGLLQATVTDWLNSTQASVLNQAFNLDDKDKCLTDLVTDTKTALSVASARHWYSSTTKGVDALPPGPDQVDWAHRWAQITCTYNSKQDTYKLGKKCSGAGLNEVMERAIDPYEAR
jgi:hypothetical protein